jgi:hypothetical protein
VLCGAPAAAEVDVSAGLRMGLCRGHLDARASRQAQLPPPTSPAPTETPDRP